MSKQKGEKRIAELQQQLSAIERLPCSCPISRTGLCCRCQDWFDIMDEIVKIKKEISSNG